MATATTLPSVAVAAQTQPKPYSIAQLLEQRLEYRLPTGTQIPVQYNEAERIIIKPDETAEVNLIVADDVRSPSTNRVVIPENSVITGELRPTDNGTQFVSESIVFPDTSIDNDEEALTINATSDEITDTQIITEDSDPDILRGAIVGGAAAAVLSEIFGSIDILEVLGGAGVGVLAEILINQGNEDEVEVIIIEPETDLDLTLESDFVRE
ncbi:MAG: hypothetical protein ACTS2F_00310 [Thainema sp.]